MSVQPNAFFLDTPGGPRFCQLYSAQGSIPRGMVLYVHPFTEEMNKSRRMAALQARALCAAGYTVLQFDLHGCGDSSGDFGDATWQGWVDDTVFAGQWLKAKSSAPLWLWGLRAGCLLAVEAAKSLGPCDLLFWAPTPSGKPLLQQFLRLKAAGDMVGGQAKVIMEGLRQQLAAGHAVEIAGYALSRGMAQGLEQAALIPLAHVRRVVWLELSTRPDASLTPVAVSTIAGWREAGVTLQPQIVNGPAFWQTTEIEEAPALIAATVASMSTPVDAVRDQATSLDMVT
ncbi:hydrolase 2, exosortase A system-associated [Rhodoferax koreense]|uniref:Hydrolase 2, exosortase A system-associated n=1 Tax=Rhodoferax koreensis TaxID=1842727 RepID=A0A1P8K0L5_9BURK|nr:hydrolase 2, exosortase A system-associated [Rhodoferax koreense]APW39481.1 hydrolase 2, exosortase A system-associated [Rhodoferax koreense]